MQNLTKICQIGCFEESDNLRSLRLPTPEILLMNGEVNRKIKKEIIIFSNHIPPDLTAITIKLKVTHFLRVFLCFRLYLKSTMRQKITFNKKFLNSIKNL